MTCRKPGGNLPAWFVAATSLIGLAPGEAARADQILTNGRNYPAAKVVGLEEGQLRFRSADGKLRTAWPDEIELIVVDRGGLFADFNQAERFMANAEPERAAVRYRRALRLGEEFWPDLIAARLALAYDAAGELDKAARAFIRVLEGRWAGPAAAARLIPQAIPTRRDGKTIRALQNLDGALSKNPDEAQRALLEALRYRILKCLGDKATDAAARTIALLPIPARVRSEPVYRIVLEGLRDVLKDDVEAATLGGLDRAIRDCPDALLPDFLLLKGGTLLRTASTKDEIIRASWPLLRATIHFPDHPRAADGLYGAALAVERIGRADLAAGLLEECLGHKLLSGETRQKAEEALARFRAALNATE